MPSTARWITSFIMSLLDPRVKAHFRDDSHILTTSVLFFSDPTARQPSITSRHLSSADLQNTTHKGQGQAKLSRSNSPRHETVDLCFIRMVQRDAEDCDSMLHPSLRNERNYQNFIGFSSKEFFRRTFFVVVFKKKKGKTHVCMLSPLTQHSRIEKKSYLVLSFCFSSCYVL